MDTYIDLISDNNEINLVSFERSMLQDSDYNKLKNPGTHTIEISYEGFKTTLTIIIYNAIVIACFTVLSIFFAKWWIMFFALLFIASYPRKKTRICDMCHRSFGIM